MTSGSIAIVVSLVGVAGSLLANFFQFRKDGNRIADINATASKIASESSGGYSRDYIVTGIDEVYKENLHLKELLRENEVRIHELEMERNINLSQISELKTQNSQLLSDLKKKDRNKSQGR